MILEPLDVPLEGRNLIEASAGTGKTYTITTLYLRLVVQEGLRVDQILVVTFTEAATAELRQRLRSRLRACLEDGEVDSEDPLHSLLRAHNDCEDRLKAALRNFDEAAIYTIHGFCQRVLERDAFGSAVPFRVELVADLGVYERDVISDFWTRTLYEASPFFVEYLRLRKVTPQSLLGLFRRRNPATVLEPPAPNNPAAVDCDESTYRAQFETVRKIWHQERDTIAALLSDHPNLHRGRYGAKKLEPHLLALDAFFAEARPASVELPKGIRYIGGTKVRADTKKGKDAPEHAILHAVDRLFLAQEELLSSLDTGVLALKHQAIQSLVRGLEHKKQQAQVQGFDDLLLRLDHALQSSGGELLAQRLLEQYPAALVDEFQDTDPTQYNIFRAIYRDGRGIFFAIGDPKQAIYAFRGADLFTYFRAAQDAGPRRFTLNTNYRSDAKLVHATNAVFSTRRDAFIFDQIEFQPVQAQHVDSAQVEPMQLHFLHRPLDARGRPAAPKLPAVVHWVVQSIAALLRTPPTIDGRTLTAHDIAVLVRTNAQAEAIRGALTDAGIHAVANSAGSVFATEEAEELLAIMQAIAFPHDEGALRRALVTSVFGFAAQDIEALAGNEGARDEILVHFQHLKVQWSHRGFVSVFRKILESPSRDQRPTRATLLSRPRGERKLTNLMHLTELIHETSRRQHLGIQAQLSWLTRMCASDTASDPVHELRLESDEDALSIMTVHASKGLEFGVVLCPFLWESRTLFLDETREPFFHDGDHGDRATISLSHPPPAAALEEAHAERRAENLRLAYVALTRAKHLSLVLVSAAHPEAPICHLLFPEGVPETDEEAAQSLELFAQTPGQGTCFRGFEPAPIERHLTAPHETTSLPVKRRTRIFESGARFGSFSQLTAGKTHNVDRQANASTLARGPLVGRCLHEIYERINFRDFDRESVLLLADAAIEGYGLSGTLDRQATADAVLGTLEAHLDPTVDALSLASLKTWMPEFEFAFPVRHQLTPHRLGEALAGGGFDEGYAQSIADLSFTTLEGYLRGFIDLVFEFSGRWYVADYKSNDLESFDNETLRAVMGEQHYFLQALLYSVAVHRHLLRQVPGYEYDQHFGGFHYLFVRGMSVTEAPGTGVFAMRPERRLIEALSDLFEGSKS